MPCGVLMQGSMGQKSIYSDPNYSNLNRFKTQLSTFPIKVFNHAGLICFKAGVTTQGSEFRPDRYRIYEDPRLRETDRGYTPGEGFYDDIQADRLG